jgi:hypothetical protein
MTFDAALTARINEEILRLTDHMLGGNMDLRVYDRYIGGIHALKQINEYFIPEVREILNER